MKRYKNTRHPFIHFYGKFLTICTSIGISFTMYLNCSYLWVGFFLFSSMKKFVIIIYHKNSIQLQIHQVGNKLRDRSEGLLSVILDTICYIAVHALKQILQVNMLSLKLNFGLAGLKQLVRALHV